MLIQAKYISLLKNTKQIDGNQRVQEAMTS